MGMSVVPASGTLPYPPATKDLHHEVELVVALKEGGAVALVADAKLVLRDIVLTRNRATLKGGGALIATAGKLELVRVRMTDNSAGSAAAIDLSGQVKARAVALLVTDNNVAANIDGPVRLTGAASLELRLSTIAYNSGSAVVLAPGPAGSGALQVDRKSVV